MRLETERLILRRFRDEDREPFAAMNADPVVMRYFPSTLTRQQADDLIDLVERHFDEHALGFFAMEERTTGAFVGFTGLARPSFDAHFTPCVEIGWRVAAKFHNQGFATEAARECLRHAFEDRGFPEVYAFTALANAPSRRVMEKLGMQYQGDFLHPKLPADHALAAHALYCIRKP